MHNHILQTNQRHIEEKTPNTNSHTTTRTQLKYSKTCVKRPLPRRPKIGFQDQLSLNAGQMDCRMLQGEHSAILSTFFKLPLIIKIFLLSCFEWLFWFYCKANSEIKATTCCITIQGPNTNTKHPQIMGVK